MGNIKNVVLLVEDDEDLILATSELILILTGAECIKTNGLDAVIANKDLIFSKNVFLAIIDINLGFGKPNGIDVFDWLKKNNFNQKCVFLTGHAKDHPLLKEAAAENCIEVFEKPQSVHNLKLMIEKAQNIEINMA